MLVSVKYIIPKKKYYCIPAKGSGHFVSAMEEVLDAYQHVNDESEVLVCMDETSKQQTREVVTPIEAVPGRCAIHDFEYVRNGVSSVFMFYAPHEDWRRVVVTDRRTRIDWAHQIKEFVDDDYPDRQVTLVMDNLNTHCFSSLYHAIPPEEAHRIKSRIDIVYTPKHGSWLNMAEIEIGVLSRQCLNRRIPDQATLKAEVAAWQEKRNAANGKVNWTFKTDDARVRLRSLYPEIQCG